MNNEPLCVDLDGTLVTTNTLFETAVGALKKNPFFIIPLLGAMSVSKAEAKHVIGRQFFINASPVPYNTTFLNWITEQHANGRRLILATASDHNIAIQISQELGIFSEVIASTPSASVTASGKALVLCRIFGTKGFAYAGNSRSDILVWNCAKSAILVDTPQYVVHRINKDVVIEKQFTTHTTPKFKVIAGAMRVHQWTKNTLLFLPALSAHVLTQPNIALHAVLGFISFSFLASAVYIFNDIADISSDRTHVTKKNRPIASGRISLKNALILGTICLFLSILIATTTLPISFIGILALYLGINVWYSLLAKKIAYIDIIILAGLYVLRIFAGSFATGITTSKWLFAWALFFFLSLAIIKRITELLPLNDVSQIAHGRGYKKSDTTLLTYIGISSSVMSVIILGFYIQSNTVYSLYEAPFMLWTIVGIILVWLIRIWKLALLGKIPADPVLFATKDVASYIAILVIIATMTLAS